MQQVLQQHIATACCLLAIVKQWPIRNDGQLSVQVVEKESAWGGGREYTWGRGLLDGESECAWRKGVIVRVEGNCGGLGALGGERETVGEGIWSGM